MDHHRLTVLILALAGCLSLTTADGFNCARTSVGSDVTGFPKQVCYIPKCTTAIKNHIKNEFDAAFKYMYMASHFAQDTVARPGLAKFLFEAASEERGHAIQMLDYLNLRGIKIDNTLDYNFNADTEVTKSLTYKGALEEAVNMEIQVTDLIYNVVKECADDYHGADVFTNPILDEQHDGLRKLQGAVRTFSDLQSGTNVNEAFVEYMFDLKMMSGELF